MEESAAAVEGGGGGEARRGRRRGLGAKTSRARALSCRAGQARKKRVERAEMALVFGAGVYIYEALVFKEKVPRCQKTKDHRSAPAPLNVKPFGAEEGSLGGG
jgi:hypothetical protein